MFLEPIVNKAWALVVRHLAVRLTALEIELTRELEQQAAELRDQGKADQADRILAIAHGDLPQLNGARRGRPARKEGGASHAD